MREGEGGPPQICSNLLPFRGINGIRGDMYPTTFTPHVWHLRGKLGVNLTHLPPFTPSSKTGPIPAQTIAKSNIRVTVLRLRHLKS
jgi:hypothetical protein